jgi:hypothetical protein
MACLGGTSLAQQASQNLEVSPQLQQFLSDHPQASQILSKGLAEAFSNRKLLIYYFYTKNESVPRASHIYPDKSSVSIFLRENQLPCDEYICLFFEILNSEGESNFQQLALKARAGQISKKDFATCIMRQEFQAVKRTRDSIGSLGLNQKEIGDSYYFNRFVNTPNDFDKFLVYIKQVSPQRDQFAEYERYYDNLNKGNILTK